MVIIIPRFYKALGTLQFVFYILSCFSPPSLENTSDHLVSSLPISTHPTTNLLQVFFQFLMCKLPILKKNDLKYSKYLYFQKMKINTSEGEKDYFLIQKPPWCFSSANWRIIPFGKWLATYGLVSPCKQG